MPLEGMEREEALVTHRNSLAIAKGLVEAIDADALDEWCVVVTRENTSFTSQAQNFPEIIFMLGIAMRTMMKIAAGEPRLFTECLGAMCQISEAELQEPEPVREHDPSKVQ